MSCAVRHSVVKKKLQYSSVFPFGDGAQREHEVALLPNHQLRDGAVVRDHGRDDAESAACLGDVNL
jgi:hypothetical protein